MNFQQSPFAGPFMQSMQSPPPFNPQFPASNATPSMTPSMTSNMATNMAPNMAAGLSAPQWATQIMEDIKSIKQSVSKIDEIEKFVNKINLKVETLEVKVNEMSTKVTDVEQSNEFINKEYEDTKTKLKSANDDIKRLNTKCKDFENKVKMLETQNQTLENKTDDLEARSMRENLLFHGIPELPNENCELQIKQFLVDKLSIDDDIKLDRAHRLGKPKGNNRPIVVKFHSYKDRELVRTTAQTKANELKNFNQGVGIQQTKAVLQKRKTMSAAFEREKAAGRSVKWAGAKLMVRDGDVGNFREVKE